MSVISDDNMNQIKWLVNHSECWSKIGNPIETWFNIRSLKRYVDKVEAELSETVKNLPKLGKVI